MNRASFAFDSTEIFRKNPQLDAKKVEDLNSYCRAISRAGIDISPRYRLSPALGQFVASVAQDAEIVQAER
ncbi:MAG: hypothetical protein U0183_15550 [Polyangiaceae bacterium]